MLDSRTMGRMWMNRASARETLRAELRRAGYDPATLDALPDPGECGCALAVAIRRFQAADSELTAAENRAPSRV